MDWLTEAPPEAELPEDLREDIYIPPIKLAIDNGPSEVMSIPLAKVHPQKILKVHAVLAKKPKKGKRK